MRIVISGTHASGKSTLISDFAQRHRDYLVLPDPFDDLLDDLYGAGDPRMFAAQLEIASRRLLACDEGSLIIAERGPLDFLAYLDALDRLGRPSRSRSLLRAGHARSRHTAPHIDLMVLLPLTEPNRIEVSDDEDPELRQEMNDALLDLADDTELLGARTVEITGSRSHRLSLLEAAIRSA